MEEKKVTKISLSTLFLILAIIVIVVMGIYIYKLNNNKTTELYVVKEININSENSLYNFKTKEWVQQINGAEGMYYIAIDNEKNLYIVDRFENVLKKLGVKLEKLNLGDTNVDNHVTYANVSRNDNTLVISTNDDFITYIVSLEDLSTKLAEINDY